jgi:hypothetical protein
MREAPTVKPDRGHQIDPLQTSGPCASAVRRRTPRDVAESLGPPWPTTVARPSGHRRHRAGADRASPIGPRATGSDAPIPSYPRRLGDVERPCPGQGCSTDRIEVAPGERQCRVDPQPSAPEPRSALGRAVPVFDCGPAHHRDDLLHDRPVGPVAQAHMTRWERAWPEHRKPPRQRHLTRG